MSAAGNTLTDFPAETFTILALCDACGHSAPLDRARVSAGDSIQDLSRKLRCSRCGSREASIRIVYAGAGGFRYGRSRSSGDSLLNCREWGLAFDFPCARQTGRPQSRDREALRARLAQIQ